jgi:hypothetical protein
MTGTPRVVPTPETENPQRPWKPWGFNSVSEGRHAIYAHGCGREARGWRVPSAATTPPAAGVRAAARARAREGAPAGGAQLSGTAVFVLAACTTSSMAATLKAESEASRSRDAWVAGTSR